MLFQFLLADIASQTQYILYRCSQKCKATANACKECANQSQKTSQNISAGQHYDAIKACLEKCRNCARECLCTANRCKATTRSIKEKKALREMQQKLAVCIDELRECYKICKTCKTHCAKASYKEPENDMLFISAYECKDCEELCRDCEKVCKETKDQIEKLLIAN
ncbi:MAG: hypothetical protein H6850_02775 [Alphaproteobacteria bacterium]|nr:MAG: hypothetical protein H6850_02775 [Alphaproteobacteria bacterium]